MPAHAARPLLMLDVDGPLCDPLLRRCTRDDVREGVVELARRGWCVALNTGRALTTVRRMVLEPWGVLSHGRPHGAGDLADIVVSCEKGAVVAGFAPGDDAVEIDGSLRVDPEVRAGIAGLVADSFAAEMFVDDEKVTMVSVEMNPDLEGGLVRYGRAQAGFTTALQALLGAASARGGAGADALHVDVSIISVDVERRLAGDRAGASKSLGARRIVERLAARGIVPSRAVCVGDSASDFEMSGELACTLDDVVHVHVGAGGVPARGPATGAVRIVSAPENNESGTAWGLSHVLAASW